MAISAKYSNKRSANRFADREYLHAKIHALRPALLQQSDYEKAASADQLHQAFPDLNFEKHSDTPGKAKEILFREEINIILTFLMTSQYYRTLFTGFLRFFEIQNLKQLLARAFNKKHIFHQWYDISPHQSFGSDLLTQDLSPKDIKELLLNTYLKTAAKDKEFCNKYEVAESSIDFSFAVSLLHTFKDQSIDQQQRFLEIMFVYFEVLKRLWACRLKQNYGWNTQQISSHLERLKNITDGIKGAKAIAAASEHRFKKNLRACGLNKDPTTAEFESALKKSFRTYIWKTFSKDFHSVNCVVCYLWLRYYQTQNLFSIVEGISFHAAPGAIISRLIC